MIGGNGDTNGDGVIRILPMGDSITATGCRRSILYNRLVDNFETDVDFTDGVHPYTDSGTGKMVDAWYDALLPWIADI